MGAGGAVRTSVVGEGGGGQGLQMLETLEVEMNELTALPEVSVVAAEALS